MCVKWLTTTHWWPTSGVKGKQLIFDGSLSLCQSIGPSNSFHSSPLPSWMLKGADLTFLHWNNTVDGNHLAIHRDIVACRIQSMRTKELIFINSLKEFSIHSVDWIRKTIFIRFPSLLLGPFLPPSPPRACKFSCLSSMYDWCNLNVFSYWNHLHLSQMSCNVTFFYLQDPLGWWLMLSAHRI